MSNLSAEGISVSYPSGNGRKRVLDPLNVKIRKGESVVVLGPSGCGKSTLLNVLAGFQRPDSGRILFNGKELTGPGGERGVVFQDDALMPWLNARDNVALGLRIAGIGRAARHQQAAALLGKVGLEQFANQRPSELSGGQRQRLGLARALAVDPDFLLLDEPFGALDALTRERMQGLLLGLWRDTRKGIFMITHSIEEALLLATDLVVMGGPPGHVVEHKALNFATRFVAGETPRALRGDPEFVRHREHINQLLDDMSQQALDGASTNATAGKSHGAL